MRIELQQAFTQADIPNENTPCALCEIEFKGKAVIIRTDPYGYEACEDCLQALSLPKSQVPEAPWPTWAEYQALVESYPEPMFASNEEYEASGPMADYWLHHAESFLWEAPRD